MIEDLVIWIGTVAGILVLLSFVPQIMKAYKTKKMVDVSIHLMILIASGTNATRFALNVTLLLMKLKYDKLQSSAIKTS